MRLRLTIAIPESAEPNLVLAQLLGCALNEQGITICTPRQWHADVDLVNVEYTEEVLT